MTLEEIAAALTAIVAIGGGLTYLYNKIVKPVLKLVTAAAELLDHQLKPNSGSSLTDKVDKLVAEIPEIKAAITRIEVLIGGASERTNSN